MTIKPCYIAIGISLMLNMILSAGLGAMYYGLGTERDFYRYQAIKAVGFANEAIQASETWHELSKKYSTDIFILRAIARIEKKNPKAPAERITLAIVRQAETYDLDRVWLLAQMEQESHYNPKAVGLDKERGLMQISRGTAVELGLSWDEAFDIEKNIEAGARYMATHIKTYGTIQQALLRYNGGNPEYPRLIRTRYESIVQRVGGV